MSSSAMPEQLKRPLPSGSTRTGWSILVAGLALAAVGYLVEPVRSAFDNVILFLFVASLAGGAIFLVALEYVAGAVWSVPMRRINEFLAGLTPLVPLLAIPLLLNLHDTFHWTHQDVVEADAVLQGKQPYLNIPFFVTRFVVIFAVWYAFYWLFVRNSTKQDSTKDPKLTTYNIRLGAVFMPIFAITVSVLAIDWGMSLEPHWFSTIYGVYYFSGTVLAAVAAATFVILKLHEGGYLPTLRRDHLYSLGALQFAFVNFWAYIAFSQFLLIWYANIPEETVWFIDRWKGGWEYFSVLLIVVQFGVPYFFLLSQDSKMDPKRLKFMSVWILAAHLIDLYWLVMPTHTKTLDFAWVDFVYPLIAVGLVWVLLSFKIGRRNIVPIGDPKLQRGLDFRL